MEEEHITAEPAGASAASEQICLAFLRSLPISIASCSSRDPVSMKQMANDMHAKGVCCSMLCRSVEIDFLHRCNGNRVKYTIVLLKQTFFFRSWFMVYDCLVPFIQRSLVACSIVLYRALQDALQLCIFKDSVVYGGCLTRGVLSSARSKP